MKRITAWAAVLTLTLSLLTGCAQIDESSADELPFPSEETPVEEEHSGLPAVFALPYLEGQPLNPLSCPDGVQQTVASLLYEGLFRLDQTFRPDTYITRAQAMTMINRVLNRIPEDESDLLPGMNVWPDCNPGDWFYLAVQEATNSHDYKHKAGNYETWSSMNKDPDWTRYEN